MTGGIAKVVIFSFTERGTKQNRYIYRKLKMQGYICEGYAPAKYVMGEEGGVKQLPKKKEDLIREMCIRDRSGAAYRGRRCSGKNER